LKVLKLHVHFVVVSCVVCRNEKKGLRMNGRPGLYSLCAQTGIATVHNILHYFHFSVFAIRYVDTIR